MENQLVRSYKSLRNTVGLMGMLLPVVLFIAVLGDIQPSISQFYYTGLRDIFVGTLCSVSVFMFFYKGYDKKDAWLATFAGVFAACVALFPCEGWTRIPHLTSAALLFIIFGIFSAFRFTKTSLGIIDKMKRIRNNIYQICGTVIFVSMLVLVVYMGFNINNGSSHETNFIFWMETIMLEAFGISWLVKGGYILKDKK